MILLCLYQNNIKKNLFNKTQKVFLINPIWLNEYGYKNIKNFVDSNINKLGNPTYDMESASKIIQSLDKAQLKNYDKELNAKTSNPQTRFNKYLELTIKDKEIYFSKNFFLLNEDIYKFFVNLYGRSLAQADILYINKKGEGDIFIINNYYISLPQKYQFNMQNLIFVGIINFEQAQFDIQHIFQYKDTNIFLKEQDLFLKSNVNNYIAAKTILPLQNNFSPIFDDNNNQIIGNYYKYKEGFD